MQQPIFSVVIDTYNHEKFIEQAIRSVLDQDFSATELEVIVVDDGSCDATAQIASQFEPRIRLIRKQNGGQASAFNAGIAAANADFVAFLDADDWWAPGKLRAVLAVFNANPTIAAVGHGYFEVIDNVIRSEMAVSRKDCLLKLSTPETARVADLGRPFLGASRLVVRTSVLRALGEIPQELVFAADTPIFVFALAMGGALVLDKPLCYYRLHSPDRDQWEPVQGEHSVGHNFHATYVKERDYKLNKFLLDWTPRRLRELGVPPDVVAAYQDADRVEMRRFELQRAGGGRRKTFATETTGFSISYRSATLGYRIFRRLISLLALLLPARQFYILRTWYSSQRTLHRVRAIFGSGTPMVTPGLFERRFIAK